VILNYNGAGFIERCLESVLETDSLFFEVIFVDNASTDGSVDTAKELFEENPYIRIILNDENLGFAKGNNLALEHAKGDYIVFLNNDTEVAKNWLKELVDVLKSSPRIGAVQPKLLKLHDHKRIDSTGGFFDFLGYAYVRGEGELDKRQYDHSREIFYADGASLAIKRSAIDETRLNGAVFDPDYFAYYEDSDLCWRLRLRGYRIVFVPTSVVYHARSASKGLPLKLAFHSTKNHIATLIKNYGLGKLVKYIFPLLTFESVRALVFLKWRRLGHFWAMMRAILWNLKNLKKTWKKRQIVQYLIRKTPDALTMEQMNKIRLIDLYSHFKSLHNVSHGEN